MQIVNLPFLLSPDFCKDSRLVALCWLQVSQASESDPPPLPISLRGGFVLIVHSSPWADLLAFKAASSLASFSRS